jgi:hypothetical protein
MPAFFVSHSSAHTQFCDSLRAALSALGHVAWLDAYDIRGGDSIPTEIVEGIYRCDYFLLLVTPEIHRSSWVNWELAAATYREVEDLKRTFVIPALRGRTPRPRLVAHKNSLDFDCAPDEAASRLSVAVGGPTRVIPELPPNACGLTMCIKPLGEMRISARRLEDAFWAAAFGNGRGVFRYFPAVTRGVGVSVGSDRVVVSSGDGERDTICGLESTGLVTVREVCYASAPPPYLEGKLLVQKIAMFIQFAWSFARAVGMEVGLLQVESEGLGRPFLLNVDTRDLEAFSWWGVRSQFDLGPGGRLHAASQEAFRNELSDEHLIAAVYEFQADLLHPLRLSGFSLTGKKEFSVRFNKDAVRRYVEEAARFAVIAP